MRDDAEIPEEVKVLNPHGLIPTGGNPRDRPVSRDKTFSARSWRNKVKAPVESVDSNAEPDTGYHQLFNERTATSFFDFGKGQSTSRPVTPNATPRMTQAEKSQLGVDSHSSETHSMRMERAREDTVAAASLTANVRKTAKEPKTNLDTQVHSTVDGKGKTPVFSNFSGSFSSEVTVPQSAAPTHCTASRSPLYGRWKLQPKLRPADANSVADEKHQRKARSLHSSASKQHASAAHAVDAQAGEARAPEAQASEAREHKTQAGEARAREAQAGKARAPVALASEVRWGESQAGGARVPEAQAGEARAPGPHAHRQQAASAVSSFRRRLVGDVADCTEAERPTSGRHADSHAQLTGYQSALSTGGSAPAPAVKSLGGSLGDSSGDSAPIQPVALAISQISASDAADSSDIARPASILLSEPGSITQAPAADSAPIAGSLPATHGSMLLTSSNPANLRRGQCIARHPKADTQRNSPSPTAPPDLELAAALPTSPTSAQLTTLRTSMVRNEQTPQTTSTASDETHLANSLPTAPVATSAPAAPENVPVAVACSISGGSQQSATTRPTAPETMTPAATGNAQGGTTPEAAQSAARPAAPGGAKAATTQPAAPKNAQPATTRPAAAEGVRPAGARNAVSTNAQTAPTRDVAIARTVAQNTVMAASARHAAPGVAQAATTRPSAPERAEAATERPIAPEEARAAIPNASTLGKAQPSASRHAPGNPQTALALRGEPKNAQPRTSRPTTPNNNPVTPSRPTTATRKYACCTPPVAIQSRLSDPLPIVAGRPNARAPEPKAYANNCKDTPPCSRNPLNGEIPVSPLSPTRPSTQGSTRRSANKAVADQIKHAQPGTVNFVAWSPLSARVSACARGGVPRAALTARDSHAAWDVNQSLCGQRNFLEAHVSRPNTAPNRETLKGGCAAGRPQSRNYMPKTLNRAYH